MRYNETVPNLPNTDDLYSGSELGGLNCKAVWSECLTRIGTVAFRSSTHWSHRLDDDSLLPATNRIDDGAVQLWAVLKWDMLHGHAITQMATMSAFERLLGVDNWSLSGAGGLLNSFLCQRSTLQVCLFLCRCFLLIGKKVVLPVCCNAKMPNPAHTSQ